jgi:hypothetical protein
VDLDRQAIEKRDFPIGRRGYDPAAVDAHLRALASAVEELQRTAAGPAVDSLAATAGTQVQGIIEAAEAAAAEIESQARASAKNVREQADTDAQKTRSEAIARAQAHVAAVGKATATLLQRVESLDGEANALVNSLRAGASRLAGDLAKVETNMGELYDAASRREPSAAEGEPAPPARTEAARPEAPPAQAAAGVPAAANGDFDGARLIALNMALNGESREDVNRYLAENFKLADRQKLIDEVYAAIEG